MGPDTGLNCIRTKEVVKGPADSFVRLREKVGVGGVILLILGSIPNSADPMVVWFFFIFCW